MKKAVMIIAHNGFRDEELLQPKAILERAGVKVEIASSGLDVAIGMLGAEIKPDMLLNDINIGDFYAIIFVGGSGATQYWDDPVALKLAQEAYGQKKVVGAICIAPVTLARAGILKGKRATVFAAEAAELKEAQAIYTAKPVEHDENIITASGPTAAAQFGEELVKAITQY